ncbi:MAG: hypothetical protein QM817_38595 [Archangium sp.]
MKFTSTALVLGAGLALTIAFTLIPPEQALGVTYVPSATAVLAEVPIRKRVAPVLSEQDAAKRARELVVEARARGGDPRLLGQAQAVLSKWWTGSASPDVLLMRATVKQSLHDFEGALADLDVLLASRPDDDQAWLTRATVLNVLGRYGDARASCAHVGSSDAQNTDAQNTDAQNTDAKNTDAKNTDAKNADAKNADAKNADAKNADAKNADAKTATDERMRSPSDPLQIARVVCDAPPRALSGELREALASLATLAPTDAASRAWVASVRGELERWADDDSATEKSLREALKLDADDSYTRLLLAELMLDTKRNAEVLKLYAGRALNDTELLMVVLAGGTDQQKNDLTERVAANRQRGETLHRREESRYALRVENDPAKALELAVENWKVQREPADARVLIEAARAAKSDAAAEPAKKWLGETKLPWRVLQ